MKLMNFGDWKRLNERSQELHDQEFFEELKKNCGYLFQENGMFIPQKNLPTFFRGLDDKESYLKVSPKDYVRTPKGAWNTAFLYNFSEVYFPQENRRQRSVVFTNMEAISRGWGKVYRIFPYENTKISFCEKDFNFNKNVRLYKDFINLEYRNIFLKLDKLPRTKESVDYAPVVRELFKKLENTQLEDWVLEDLFEKLFDILDTFFPEEKYQIRILEEVKKLWNSLSSFNLNRKTLEKFADKKYKPEFEFWTEGECLMINQSSFVELFNQNSKVHYENIQEEEVPYPWPFPGSI